MTVIIPPRNAFEFLGYGPSRNDLRTRIIEPNKLSLSQQSENYNLIFDFLSNPELCMNEVEVINALNVLQGMLFDYEVPKYFDIPQLSNRILTFLQSDNITIVRYTISCIANTFSSFHNDELKKLFISNNICQLLQFVLNKWETQIYPSLIILLSRISATSPIGLILTNFTIQQILIMIKDVTKLIKYSYCKILLKNIILNINNTNEAIELIQLMIQIKPLMPFWFMEYIGYCSQKISNFPEIIQNTDLCQEALAHLQSNQIDEIRAAIIFLGYAKFDASEIIINYITNENNDISSAALWYLSRYLKESKGNTQIRISNPIFIKMLELSFVNSSYQKQSECVYCICYLLQYSNHDEVINNLGMLEKLLNFLFANSQVQLTVLILQTLVILLADNNEQFHKKIVEYLDKCDIFLAICDDEFNENQQIAMLSSNVLNLMNQ